MNLKLIRQVFMMSRYLFYGIFIQSLLCGMLIAGDGAAQGELLKDIYISMDLKNSNLEDAFHQISKKTDFIFVFNETAVAKNERFSKKYKNTSVEEILKDISVSFKLKFKRADENIFVTENDKNSSVIQEVITNSEYFFQQKVSGKVTSSDDGEPLPGVSIIVRGTTQGTTTDFDGNFSMNVPNNAVLELSYIGYKTSVVEVGNQSTINVSLETDLEQLEEVVVVGYGTQKKSDLTGAVVSISDKDIGDRVTGSVANLLQGRVAGLDVTGNQIRIRGVTTLNNTDPLIVIDGILGGDMSTVNPNNIKSIEVLKDASATAIYGSRGANGVIIITTKKGTEGPVKINFNGYYGFSNPTKKLDVLSAPQYIDLVRDMRNSVGKDLTEKLESDDVLVDRTNWQDAITRTARTQEYNIDFSGGTSDANYYVAAGYKNFQSIYIGPETNRYFLNLKNSFKVKDIITIGGNALLRSEKETGEDPWSKRSAIEMPPYYEVLDPNNYWGYSNVNRTEDLTDVYNPVPQSALVDREVNRLNYMVSGFVDIEPLRGLVWKTQFTARGSKTNSEQFNQEYINGGNQFYNSSLSKGASHRYSPLLENYLTFSKEFGEHNFSAMAGNTYAEYGYEGSISINGIDFDNDEVRLVTNGETYRVSKDERGHWASLSYFGRINYGFKNRYLLTVNYRRDASNKFAPSNRWGDFPSLALGWKIHEEGFMQGLGGVSQLKLRASWGISGNDGIGSYRFISNVHQGAYYVLGGQLQTGATVMDNYAPNIKWESTESTNIGVDLGLFDDKLTITGDYFIKNTNDILFPVPRPLSTGYGANRQGGDAIVNAASVKNEGIELTANYRKTSGDFSYGILGHFTYVKNNVTSLGLGQPFIAPNGINRTDVGNPIGYFYGYTKDRIYMNQAEVDADNAAAQEKGFDYYQNSFTAPGDVRFVDINGDGKVDSEDRGKIGSPIPNLVFGLNANFAYKGLDFNMVFSGVSGNQIYYGSYFNTRGMARIKNHETYVLDRWRSESEPGNGKVPRAYLGDKPQNNRQSTMMIEDGAYLRMQQLSVGYSFNNISALTKDTFSRLRVYVSADNLFVLTKFSGYDPEVGGEYKRENLARGVSGTGMASRTIVMGLQFGL